MKNTFASRTFRAWHFTCDTLVGSAYNTTGNEDLVTRTMYINAVEGRTMYIDQVRPQTMYIDQAVEVTLER